MPCYDYFFMHILLFIPHVHHPVYACWPEIINNNAHSIWVCVSSETPIQHKVFASYWDIVPEEISSRSFWLLKLELDVIYASAQLSFWDPNLCHLVEPLSPFLHWFPFPTLCLPISWFIPSYYRVWELLLSSIYTFMTFDFFLSTITYMWKKRLNEITLDFL